MKSTDLLTQNLFNNKYKISTVQAESYFQMHKKALPYISNLFQSTKETHLLQFLVAQGGKRGGQDGGLVGGGVAQPHICFLLLMAVHIRTSVVPLAERLSVSLPWAALMLSATRYNDNDLPQSL